MSDMPRDEEIEHLPLYLIVGPTVDGKSQVAGANDGPQAAEAFHRMAEQFPGQFIGAYRRELCVRSKD